MTDDYIRRAVALDACHKVADEAKAYGIPQMTMGAHTCRDAIRALPAAQVAVKPLEWLNVSTIYGPETYEAYAATGFYQVFTDDDSCCGAVFAEFAVSREQFGTNAARGVARVNGFAEAKAAAQADYEARIRAAMTVDASPAPDPATNAACCQPTLADAPEVQAHEDAKPMTRINDLRALEKAVAAGEIIRSDLDAFIPVFGLTTNGNNAHSAYNGSLDAAKALHEALLPGWDYAAGKGRLEYGAFVARDLPYVEFEAYAENSARAWLLAIIRALIAQDESQ